MKRKVLDITKYNCPITFIKARDFLKLKSDEDRVILIKGDENFTKLKNALEKNFLLVVDKKKNRVFEIIVKNI
jgi:TusA-related sulfurtransferase